MITEREVERVCIARPCRRRLVDPVDPVLESLELRRKTVDVLSAYVPLPVGRRYTQILRAQDVTSTSYSPSCK